MQILTFGNTKTARGEEHGWRTGVVHFAHHKTSGRNVCPWASPGCSSSCLDDSGLSEIFETIHVARFLRTVLYFERREWFLAQLYREIEKAAKKAEKDGFKLALRLNATSDIPSLAINAARRYSSLQFYDYTASIATLRRSDLPANYHLTFSRKEDNEAECLEALSLGYNVSALFEKGKFPEKYFMRPVVDGDRTDLRFIDPKGVVVALSPKGKKAKADRSGFVVRNQTN